MAVIKNGKIHGRIGRYVYRVVNGKEVVQSFPQNSKTPANTKVENQRFADVSRMNAKIYRLIKDFALAKTDKRFYYQLMAFINENFYGPAAIRSGAFATDGLTLADVMGWNPVPGSQQIIINPHLRVEEVLQGLPRMDIQDDLATVWIPSYVHKRKKNYIIPETDYLEYSISLVHYDFDLEQALHGNPVEKGLIMAFVGIRFFAAKESYGYLNTEQCNPVGVITAFYKG